MGARHPKIILPTGDGMIVTGDAIKLLDSVPDESIQLVITSPPYNIGKEYEKDQKRSIEEYVQWLKPIIGKLHDKLHDKGSICWQVGNYINKGQVFPLDYYFYSVFLEYGFQLRNRIIWHFNFGLHASVRFSGRYETLLWFTKTNKYKFNLDPVRVAQIYPGKRHSGSKGKKAGTPSGNRLGKNPSDFWEFSSQAAFQEDLIWELPNVKANHPEKTLHPCQFPSELAERCVLAFADKGDAVLDPFVGAGTSVVAAVRHGRLGLGFDRDARYARLARRRVKKFWDGELLLRPGGKLVRQPRRGEKVATIPEEWKAVL